MNFDLFYISPDLILAVGGIIALLAGITARRWTTPERLSFVSPEIVSLLVLILALVPTVMMIGREDILLGIPQFTMGSVATGMMAVDGLTIFFRIVAVLSTFIVVLMSLDYFKAIPFHRGEYYSLLIFATLAITTLAASTDMVMIYLTLEFLSITSYLLAGYRKQDPKSNEAALKYFLYGSVAGAAMIYGMSILYGITGDTNIYAIANFLRTNTVDTPLLFISILMILVGFGFKIAMVPFHQWAPDTYEGAPTPVTAFLSVGSKAAGFAVLLRVLATGITPYDIFDWVPLIIILAGVTMTVGNLIAIPQRNIKRMLAYSSIAQAGYLLLGVAAMGLAPTPEIRQSAVQAVLLYIFVYLFMNLGAFAVVTLVETRLDTVDIRDYAGLRARAPIPAWAMFFFLLSLAGIPPTAGFLGKFYLFYAAIETAQQTASSALFWLAVVAIINTVISVYYYFNVVRWMFFGEAKNTTPVPSSPSLNLVIGLTLAMTLLVLVFSQPFADLARYTANMLGGM